MKVSEEKRKQMLSDMNLDPNFEVNVALNIGQHTIKSISTDPEPYDIGGNQGKWYPVEFEDGSRVSIKTLLRSRGLQWSSRKSGDRFDALLAHGVGKTLDLMDVHEETFTKKDTGESFQGKVYTYAPVLIG